MIKFMRKSDVAPPMPVLQRTFPLKVTPIMNTPIMNIQFKVINLYGKAAAIQDRHVFQLSRASMMERSSD